MKTLATARMSSKGQVVIPQEMRKHLREGDKLVIFKNGGQIILKKMEDFSKNVEEDLEFAKRTEEAYKKIEAGECIKVNSENLEEEMMKW